MKILNLYCGIGGNRKDWGNEHQITAVEINPQIAKIYQDNFPSDKVIVGDAHKYLLEHFMEFDFIWSSPPCPSHSKLRKGFSVANGAKPIYPDMNLYQEIIFLEGYFEGKYVVENVQSYYNPLIRPVKLNRHYFWTNFIIPQIKVDTGKINLTGGWEKQDDLMQVRQLENDYDFDLSTYNLSLNMKRRLLRNCVNPKLGLHILKCGIKTKQQTVSDFFPMGHIIKV